MSTSYRSDRGCWIFRVYRDGKRHKRYGFATKAEAMAAEKRFLEELPSQPHLPLTSLARVAASYLERSAALRSKSRYQGIYYNLQKTILPHFRPDAPITSINPQAVEDFLQLSIKRVSVMTVWHYIKDLKALLNWAKRQGLLQENPVDRADLSALKKRGAVKLPLSLRSVELAAASLSGKQRLYFDTLRFMGLRKAEGNALRVEDLKEVDGQLWMVVRGTKTAGSHRILPVPPLLWEGFHSIIPTLKVGDYIFGRSKNWTRHESVMEGGLILVSDRRKLFKKIERASGVKLRPKDLRDYFASVMSDPIVASKMLGHTSLRTTAIYTREVRERMLAGVKELGNEVDLW